MAHINKYCIGVILLITQLVCVTIYGQKNIDSLTNLLKTSDNSEKFKVLSELSLHYFYIDSEKSLLYGEEALKTASALKDDSKMASANYKIGFSYYRLGKYSEALKYLNISAAIYQKLTDEITLAKVKSLIAIVYMEMKRYDLALDYFNRLLTFYSEKNMMTDYSTALINISSVFLDRKDYDKALEGFFKVLDINNKIGYKNNDVTATVYCNIGEAYYGKKQFGLSFKYRKMSLDLYNEMNFTDGIANLQMDIGLSLMKLKDYGQAKQYLSKALENYKTIKYGEGIRKTKENFIVLFKETNQWDNALAANTEYEALSLSSNDSSSLARSYDMYADIYFATNNYKSSAEYYKKYIDLKEKLDLRENKQRMAELQTVFETEEKDFENKSLRQENELQKEKLNAKENVLLAVLVGIILASILLFILYQKEKKIKRINEKIKNQNKTLEEHIVSKDKFFSILAHNLKNPFWAILGQNKLLEDNYEDLTESERKELISRIGTSAANVYKLFEDLLRWAKSQQNSIEIEKDDLPLKELIRSSIKPYSLIAQNKKIKLEVCADDNAVLKADKFMMETVIGNLVDNAIKYSDQNEKIIISGKEENGGVELAIEDHGTGMGREKLERLFKIDEDISTLGTMNERGTGLGLIICKEFVEKHSGRITVESKEGKGTTFRIYIPQN